jgi:hypothetical protein
MFILKWKGIFNILNEKQFNTLKELENYRFKIGLWLNYQITKGV